VRFGRDDLPLRRPAIAYLSGLRAGHFVTLRPVGITGTMVQVIDPPDASRIMDYQPLLARPDWTGRLLVPRTAGDDLAEWSWFLVLLLLPLAVGPPRRWVFRRWFGPVPPVR
jgi:hypothetical protein